MVPVVIGTLGAVTSKLCVSSRFQERHLKSVCVTRSGTVRTQEGSLAMHAQLSGVYYIVRGHE